jgi:hypothetical protein
MDVHWPERQLPIESHPIESQHWTEDIMQAFNFPTSVLAGGYPGYVITPKHFVPPHFRIEVNQYRRRGFSTIPNDWRNYFSMVHTS